MDFDGIVTLGEVIFLALAALGFGVAGFRALARRRELRDTFSLSAHYRYPVADEDSGSPSMRVPIGEYELIARVRVRYAMALHRMSVRFVADAKGGDADPDAIQVVEISDKWLKQTKLRDYSYFRRDIRAWPDEAGGLHGVYDPPQFLGKGEALHIGVHFKATKPWSGFLRFGSYDKSGELRYCYLPFEAAAPKPQAPDAPPDTEMEQLQEVSAD